MTTPCTTHTPHNYTPGCPGCARYNSQRTATTRKRLATKGKLSTQFARALRTVDAYRIGWEEGQLYDHLATQSNEPTFTLDQRPEEIAAQLGWHPDDLSDALRNLRTEELLTQTQWEIKIDHTRTLTQ